MDIETEQDTPYLLSNPYLWSVLYVTGLLSSAFFGGNLAEPWRSIAFWLALSLAIPMLITSQRYNKREGVSSAFRTYSYRALAAMGVYILLCSIAMSLREKLPPGSPQMWALAVLPVLPLLGMICAMGRYFREESDEYLRYRAVVAALIGLALVMGAATVWGFLEMFALVPHVPSWWVLPGWAVGQTAGHAVLTARGR